MRVKILSVLALTAVMVSSAMPVLAQQPAKRGGHPNLNGVWQ